MKDAFKEDIEAVRILGMTPQGQQYLKCLKKKFPNLNMRICETLGLN
jgi:predicted nucleotidyltransferase